MGNDTTTDPFSGLGTMPAVTTLFRDMSGIRFQHPQWIAENCTACGRCYTVCPDTAIPGLVNEVTQVFDTIVNRIRKHGVDLKHLPKVGTRRRTKLAADSCRGERERQRFRHAARSDQQDDSRKQTGRTRLAMNSNTNLSCFAKNSASFSSRCRVPTSR